MNTKKNLMLFSVLALGLVFSYQSKTSTQISVDTQIDDALTTLHYRFKHGGCYGGNIISFMTECAKLSGKDQDYTGKKDNCPS
ncbi:hypothetical protein [Tenuifilum thalassicum]|uniref:Uncharacterized protein n=1 Tax=Tenuifilum thalassicum TaxID=2590900 RepID=A0A7D4BA40_9BACT|nr:hypothetical protein [Tenuifilum thalassicum]QKG79180.1 hypothetical protein FHG85_02515 [Tenuifilum thalassicum]